MRKVCLAIDIGASSGRHIAGYLKDGEMETVEVYRFRNGMSEIGGHLVWDIEGIEREVKTGICKAMEQFEIRSLSIDTWGVDYVLLDGDTPIPPVYAYRDKRTRAIVDKVHGIVPFEELYERTGSQFQTFNSIYQLYHDKESGRLENASDFLMIPEYLMYRLTGCKAKEFTNATTTGLVNASTLTFDTGLIERLGLPSRLFPELRQPGSLVGTYLDIPILLCPTHDTASAVEGIPMDKEGLYISSGTWSLLGVKTPRPITTTQSREANFSNEGGVGYNRYQKNIMGMWLVNRLRDELCPDEGIADIVKKAERSAFAETVNADDPSLLSPDSMKQAFDALIDRNNAQKPQNRYGYFSCAYRSLAFSYRKAIDELESNTGRKYDTLYIVGGGAKNAFLNSLTEIATNKKVIALEIEATAIGNLKNQMRHMALLDTV